MPGYLFGFDLGTKCGVTVSTTDNTFNPGTSNAAEVSGITAYELNLSPKRHEGGGMRPLRFRRHLLELFTTTMGADTPAYVEVGFEEVRKHAGTTAAHVYGGLRDTLMAVCEELNMPYRGINVGTVKRELTGRGNANKDMMMAAANHHYLEPGRLVMPVKLTDNVADALGVMHCLLNGAD